MMKILLTILCTRLRFFLFFNIGLSLHQEILWHWGDGEEEHGEGEEGGGHGHGHGRSKSSSPTNLLLEVSSEGWTLSR